MIEAALSSKTSSVTSGPASEIQSFSASGDASMEWYAPAMESCAAGPTKMEERAFADWATVGGPQIIDVIF